MKVSKNIIRPIITEKSMSLAGKGAYCFEVSLRASKGSVSAEIENLYKVNVTDITTSIVPGKMKRVMGTRKYTKLPKWKKAFVTLKEGQTLKMFETKE